MTHDNVLVDKSIDFAIRITNCYKYLKDEKKEYILSKQMFRSGTSIGANIHEAIQGKSKPDFVSKLGISLSEASETSYWLKVLHRSNVIDDKMYNSMINDLDELIRILVSTIKTTRKNMEKE